MGATMSNEKTPWQKWKENLGETRPWDLLNPNTEYASEQIANTRYEICNGCPQLIALTKQCKECGCFMNLKTKLEKAICPLGKW
jgi:hypothetical protein